MPNITPEMIEAARSAYNANTPTIIPRGGKLAHETKLMHTILTAALSAQPVVKPLEWYGPDYEDEYWASWIGGKYTIGAPNGNGLWLGGVGGYFPTVEAAKAAAQADYDARILSALIFAEPVDPSTVLFASRHNETGEIEPVYVEPEMVKRIRARMAEKRTAPSETGSDRDAVARIIDPVSFSCTPEMFGTDDEGFKRTLPYGAQLVALDRADKIISLLAPPAPTGDGWPVPEGWALVPKEPTEAMMHAGLYQSSHDAEWADVFSSWKDMLAAAPTPPKEGGR